MNRLKYFIIYTYKNNIISGSINDYVVSDRITLNWAPNSNIVWTCGRRTMKYINDNNNGYGILQDVAHKIKCRARSGYGLKVI